MRLDVRIKRIEEKINTTRYETVGDLRPMDDFYINTEVVALLAFDTDEMLLSISNKPFAYEEVGLALPAVPFFKALKGTVRYEHTVERKDKGHRKGKRRRNDKRAANTPELPVTLAYVNRIALDDDFIAGRKPIYFGISAVTEYEERAGSTDTEVASEVGDAGILAVFYDFLRESVRKRKGSRLTSRQILAMWRVRWDADPDAEVVRGIRLSDVARRFRAVFGFTATGPTRIDGRHQRYWKDYTI